MNGVDPTGLQRVVARLQDAVADPSAWHEILHQLTVAVDAEGVLLLQQEMRTRDMPGSPSLAPLMSRYFAESWHLRDFRMSAIPRLHRTGIAVDQDIVDSEGMKRNPYYCDLLQSAGLRWWAGVGFTSGRSHWCLSIQRRANQSWFDANEQKHLKTLRAGLTEVATLSAALGHARVGAAVDALQLASQPALVLNRFGRVLRENRLASDLFCDDFFVANGSIVTTDRLAANRFDELTQRSQTMDLVSSFGPILVHREGRRPLLIQPFALSDTLVETFSGGRVLLLVNDLEHRPLASAEMLRTAFGLSAAEAKLAVLVGRGVSVADASQALEISRETVRAHLKAIFGKTRTARQAEWVALFNRLSSSAPS